MTQDATAAPFSVMTKERPMTLFGPFKLTKGSVMEPLLYPEDTPLEVGTLKCPVLPNVPAAKHLDVAPHADFKKNQKIDETH